MSRVLIKNLDVLNLHPMLLRVGYYAIDVLGFDIVTSAYRPGDSGVHGQIPVRGLDIRCRDSQKGSEAEIEINSKWIYDPDRPEMKVCIGHGEGDNYHVHLQVHPKTKEV